MHIFLQFLILIFLGGCATGYILPANRFMTPETNGGGFNGHFGIQNTRGHEYKLDRASGSASGGTVNQRINRTGYELSNSLMESFDLVWNHVGEGNSLVGGKFQFVGASRVAKAAGHKVSAAFLLGQNEHESERKDIEFTLAGREMILIYGYRFTEFVMPYASVAQSTYVFEGSVDAGAFNSTGVQEFEYETTIMSLNTGIELTYMAVFGKAELSYQELDTTNSKKFSAVTIGFAGGVYW